MATKVTYNGVTMQNVTTREWDQEVVYDPSATDRVFTRYKLRFEGIIHLAGESLGTVLGSPAYVLGPGGPATPAAVYEDVRIHLSQPRKNLDVFFGADLVLRVTSGDHSSKGGAAPNDPNRDVDNGPKPRGLRISHVASNKVFRVEWSVECARVECPGGHNPIPDGVLSNRWGLTEEMDANFFTTRIIRGQIRCSSAEFPAHAFKPLIVPGLETGFKREHLDFDLHPDGLTADYVVIDRQVHTAAPYPATKISGTHVESTNDSVTYYSEMSVRLEGPPHADKRLLIARAIQVIDSRLKLIERIANTDYLIEDAAIIDHIGEENAVEARMRIRNTPEKPAQLLMGLVEEVLGQPLELPLIPVAVGQAANVAYSRTTSPFPGTWGYMPHGTDRSPATLFLLHCYLQDACGGPHHMAQIGSQSSISPPKDDDEHTTTVSYSIGAGLESRPRDEFSADAKRAMYSYSAARSRYEFSQMRAQLPIAQSPSAYTFGDDTALVAEFGLPQARRIITLEGERVGEWPTYPVPVLSYIDGALTGRLLNHVIIARPSTLSADGRQRIYRSKAIYVYALNRPPSITESVNVGTLPFTSLSVADNKLDPTKVYYTGEL